MSYRYILGGPDTFSGVWMFRVIYLYIFDGFGNKNICATKNTSLQINIFSPENGPFFLRERREIPNLFQCDFRYVKTFDRLRANLVQRLKTRCAAARSWYFKNPGRVYTLEKSHILNPKVKVVGMVGGFNPSEKYARQNGKSSPIFGVKIPKIFETTTQKSEGGWKMI